MRPGAERPDVVVIGAGVIGIAAAVELARLGAKVTVVERGPGPASGASYGNAGVVGTTHVVPLASAQSVRDGLRWMLRRHSPFSLQPRPAVVPWLGRFLLAARTSRYERSARLLAELAAESFEMHQEIGTTFDTGFARRGFLHVFETRSAFESALAHAPHGDGTEILDPASARDLCPQLAARPAGALFSPHDGHCDPLRLVQALGSLAVEMGVTIRSGVEVLAVRPRRDDVGLWTTAGDLLAGEVVLAAGAWSPRLAAGMPLRLPVQGAKGYHVDLAPAPGDSPMPVWFAECRTVATPMARGLRLTGMLQIAGTDMRVDQARVTTILRDARRLLRGVEGRPVTSVWRGLRPCSPDGLPIIGRVPDAERVIVATGHGMWGLQLAPVTARLVAAAVTGDASRADALAALGPERFRVRRT